MVTKVMNFIKNNLVPVICGTIILLALLAWFIWPIPGMQENVQAQLQARYDQIAQVNQLVGSITIPGGNPIPKATYEQNVIEAAKRIQQRLKSETEKINLLAADRNQSGRVITVGGKIIPLLAGQQEKDYLPKIVDRGITDPYYFKTDYEKQFPIWTNQLVNFPGHLDIPGIPPSQTEIHDQEARRVASAVPTNPMFAAPQPNQGADPNAGIIEAERKAVSGRANQIRMYLDPVALQRRDWAGRPTPPNETQIFEALVDCWLQQDVINAITEVNQKSVNVGESGVKRLERIIVGVSPTNTNAAGTMFFTMAGANNQPAAGTPETTGTMTGRISGTQADVVLMSIILDVDPAKQNAFIEALYRQNNGYTVLNIKTSVIDPIEAASNGFLYGKTQCVHIEVLVEAMLFRNWTTPLMPDPIRATLGLPALPPPGTPATPPAGAPAAG